MGDLAALPAAIRRLQPCIVCSRGSGNWGYNGWVDATTARVTCVLHDHPKGRPAALGALYEIGADPAAVGLEGGMQPEAST